ncbi:arylamine N-acetyltransferase [Runella sp. SP2]|uniref:arylamine N-acetyltransferase family protein n=1 Tax=Runella sp. SP2 TaxID=2268026 RepID=UPI000F092850|nr:arylamine N-acetyltransferase [Runella sp. SP2]AYQ32925.1 hypothetical protein DTQ70_12525 [Runella sp. SP2]
MNLKKYLERIKYTDRLEITDEVLFKLHQQHVHQVPFENVDIYLKRHFSLELEKVFQKIVSHKRGGFCYELNLLFNWLLNEVGFSSRIIASRIYNENGTLGPPFDHMSGYVKTNKAFLVDVGYGDLFVIPLEIKEGIQYDGRNYFRIEKLNENDFSLSMSPDGLEFQKRYLFSLDTVHLDAFTSICFDKQTHPNSYFVKNLVCTKPTQNGRITIFNEKLIEKNNRHKTETLLQGNDVLKTYLKDKFDMEVDMDFIPYHQPKMVVPVGINEI